MAKAPEVMICISDLHIGCQLALSPPSSKLDSGLIVKHNHVQSVIYAWWKELRDVWCPEVIGDRPFSLLINGDSLEGVHHGATTLISNSKSDQQHLAVKILQPFLKKLKPSKFFFVRGTPAHSGENGCDEELLGRTLGSLKDRNGRYTRQELWSYVGDRLVHATHTIGTSSIQSGESTALCREWNEIATIAGKWGEPCPHFVVRGHRHTHCTVGIPYSGGMGQAISLPAWQCKTPFCMRIAGARNSLPQIGAVALLADGTTKTFLRTIARSAPEIA